jgi:tripartite-type tricarboxylate transporter receptor subunit TctC
MRFPRPASGLLAFAALLLLLAGCSRSSGYPSAPILLICPWAVGGGTDRVSRQISTFLEAELGAPVNVINATGGAGVTGHSRGSRAAPDGYTLTMITVEINMLRWRKLTEISWEDFTPLMLVNRDAAAIFVQSDAPWRTLGELEAEVRRSPGKLKASGTATGGIWHLALAGWLAAAGMKPGDIGWIPESGAGPSLKQLASGGLDLVCCSLPEARALLGSGTVRCLGVMADSRVPRYEEVPTFKEQGADWSMGGWRGLALPKGAPDEVVEVLLRALERIVTGRTEVEGRRFPDFMAHEGFDATWELPPRFRETLRRTDAELGKFLTSPEFSGVTRSPIGPYDFPKLLFALLALILIALVLQAGEARGKSIAPAIPRRGLIRIAEVIAAVAAFVLVVEWLGFVLTAAFFLAALLRRLGTPLLSWSALFTVLLAPAAYQVFAKLLRVPLPRGLLGW